MWAPRDVLISLLRGIDAGKVSPRCLVISYSVEHEDGGTTTHFLKSAENPLEALGLLAQSMQDMQSE